MVGFTNPKRLKQSSRSAISAPKLYFWVLGAALLIQVFRLLTGVSQNLTFAHERLEITVPAIYWWTFIPLRITFWLILIPLIAAIVVNLRFSVVQSAMAHMAVLLIGIYIFGFYLHDIVHIQSDQLGLLFSAKKEFDNEQANADKDVQTSTFDPIAATEQHRKKSYAGTTFHKSHGAEYWISEASSNMMIYLAIIAAGYAVLYFRLTQYGTIEADRFKAKILQLQYESLCNRLTPHFLFNTLNTISSLTLTDGNAARNCISQLGELLRASIEALPEGEIKLQRELEILHTYLSIQQTRFGSDLEYSLEVERGLESALVPAFLLQPLVENCFKHGFKERSLPAVVKVSVKAENDSCRLEVSDNGIAQAPSQVINERYGLGLTRQRLELQYGTQAELRYEINDPNGLKVIALVPLRYDQGKLND